MRIINEDGQLEAKPFLDIRSLIVDLHPDFNERGLPGLAFHPDFQNNGKFYVAYTAHKDPQGDLAQLFWCDLNNVVAEYTVSEDDPSVADPKSGRFVRTIPWPQFNHNGHWIDVVPDAMLSIATGDGGYADDGGIGHNVMIGNGQDMTVLHGKILRTSVDGGPPHGILDDNPFAGNDDIAPEIWASGLRNPWRCSFDMGGGNTLICADVQQNSLEEVNVIEKGGNDGWRVMQASHCFDFENPNNHPAACDNEGLVMPVLKYKNCTAKPQGCKGILVTGGYVYRGGHADWDGAYIFGGWSKSFAEMDGQVFFAR